jgi:hypothetical protein
MTTLENQKQLALIVGIPITRDQIEAIIIGALEGGSNYWYWLETVPNNLPDGEFLSLRIVEALLTMPNFFLPVQDLETRTVVGNLTLESLRKAIEKAATDHPPFFQDLLDDDLDANGADLIFQLAVMGRETYC